MRTLLLWLLFLVLTLGCQPAVHRQNPPARADAAPAIAQPAPGPPQPLAPVPKPQVDRKSSLHPTVQA